MNAGEDALTEKRLTELAKTAWLVAQQSVVVKLTLAPAADISPEIDALMTEIMKSGFLLGFVMAGLDLANVIRDKEVN